MRMILALLFCLAGVAFLYVGVKVLSGSSKRWILSPHWHHPPTKTGIWRSPRWDSPTTGIAIALIMTLLGVACIESGGLVFLVPYLAPNGVLWVAAVVFVTCLLGLVLPVWRRRWFNSHWAYWLEDNYKYALNTLVDDIRRDPKGWERRVATQEGLEEWAREVAGEPRPRRRSK